MWWEGLFVALQNPKGRSSGMLVGVDLSIFNIGEIEEGDFLSNLN
jgi:hypothetical protein